MGFLKNMLDGGAGEAQKKNEANAAWLKGMLSTQHAKGQGYMESGMQALDTGYAAQKAMTAKYGEQATNQILAQQKATTAANTQGLVSKGLYNTSVGANMAAQTQSVASNSLSSLAENLGLMQSNIEGQYAAQKQQGFQSLADYAMNKVGMAQQVTPQYQGGTGIMAGLGEGLGSAIGGLFSDRRIKENIEAVGVDESTGLTLYEFNYKEGFGDTDIRYRGVMAQDVELVYPDAVEESRGHKTVNYWMLGIEMSEVGSETKEEHSLVGR
jgi:hypothetical protein